jgi:hypothetical protein
VEQHRQLAAADAPQESFKRTVVVRVAVREDDGAQVGGGNPQDVEVVRERASAQAVVEDRAGAFSLATETSSE